jgi:hypothetical protein
MGNEITTERADGQRDLAWKALNLLTSTTDRILSELGDDAQTAIAAAVAKTEYELRPVPEVGDGRAEWVAALDERLRRLAVKVAPTAAANQTVEWRTAMTEALSDLPAMIALTAAKKAIHRPFRFIGDIEAGVREIATELLENRRARLRALERMRADLERAARAAPAIAAPPPDAPITAAQIRAMPVALREMGVDAGFITREEADAAFEAEREDQLAA